MQHYRAWAHFCVRIFTETSQTNPSCIHSDNTTTITALQGDARGCFTHQVWNSQNETRLHIGSRLLSWVSNLLLLIRTREDDRQLSFSRREARLMALSRLINLNLSSTVAALALVHEANTFPQGTTSL
jgi:hypothetical protein